MLLKQPSTVVYPRHHNQDKEARLCTAAKQLKPPANRAASSAKVKQNRHAPRGRRLGLGTHMQGLPQNEPWTILKPAWLCKEETPVVLNIPAWLDLL